MFYDYGGAFGVVLFMAIGGGLVWLGKYVEGTSPTRARKILAWPFIGLGVAFACLAALDLLVNFFGSLMLEAWGFLLWLRSFF